MEKMQGRDRDVNEDRVQIAVTVTHSMEMFAFGMKIDEQALEPGTDEIRGKDGTGHYTGGARHGRDFRFKYR